eukprot:UN0221
MVALVNKFYEIVEEEVLAIVNTDYGNGNLVLLGGITVNMPYPKPGYFLPLHFSVRSDEHAAAQGPHVGVPLERRTVRGDAFSGCTVPGFSARTLSVVLEGCWLFTAASRGVSAPRYFMAAASRAGQARQRIEEPEARTTEN